MSLYNIKNINYKNILSISALNIQKIALYQSSEKVDVEKTTLLKTLNKIITPDSGDIYFLGKNLKNYNPIKLRRQVLMMSQTALIFPGSIKENLQIGFEFTKKQIVDDKNLKYYLQLVNLSKSLSDDVSNLSGGEKQKLSLARILCLDPEVILLDEPTASLDDSNALDLIKKSVEYTKKHNKSLVMITHSNLIANKYFDQVINLSSLNSYCGGN